MKIRQADPEADDGYGWEWVHEHELDQDELGVTLHWRDDRCDVFVPWGSVVRIDIEPCCCSDCRRRAA